MGVPDGRTVTVLLNAVPIRSDEGELESMVVTMQDMTAVEEVERLRVEFLAMVSHELRMPLTSIRGAVTALLDAAQDLDPAEMHQFLRIIVDRVDHMRELNSPSRSALTFYRDVEPPSQILPKGGELGAR